MALKWATDTTLESFAYIEPRVYLLEGSWARDILSGP
jgi:hypothetical protein